MQSYYDYKKFAILYVDDEEKSLKYFREAFSDQFRVFTATNAADGYHLLEQHADDIGLLMTDQRMPGEKGVQLLEKARRMLATAYSDLDAAIDAVNSGAIYKYVTKPWDVYQLEISLKRGLEFFMVQRERDQLLKEKLSVLHNLMITDRVVGLGVLASGLSHHVRNSLVAVRTFIDLAPSKLQEERLNIDDLRNPNYWRDFHDQVQSQVRRIIEMLNDLGVAAERPELLFKDRVQPGAVVNEALARLQPAFKEKNVTVTTQFGNLPELAADGAKFNRFFDLLLRDELACLPAGSQLSISAQPATGEGGAPEVRFEIKDNGPGLPAESLRSIFDPFFVRSGHPQEFGISLMACFFIVYHHGGRIEVKSGAGSGTTFIVSFPVNPQVQTFAQEEQDFLAKVLMNEQLWERLLAGQ
jgi:two-component system probable response regulator PhcQ